MSARRRWLVRAAVVAAVAVAAGCEEYPQQPQLRVQLSPNPFDFGKWYVGQAPQSSLAITNKGLDDLVLTSVTLTGDSAFAKYQSATANPTLTTIPANKSSYLVLVFTPPAVGTYAGNVNIQSNAQNAPSQDVPVSGEGVPP
ncbi:MAG TPA: choice-of-anchor D domain-containing protein [Myxococcales bacterium]|jgi:hypothetical protein|nr:choice-of-anchor D domain-containing protein [Myxococcales bacterium]